MSAFHYGGQALLEGVMIRGRQAMVAAVRAPSGEIVLHEEHLPAGRGWGRWPFLRGLRSLWETLQLGMRALTFSADVATGQFEKKAGPGWITGTVILALLFGIGLFFVVPLLLARLAERVINAPWQRTLLEGFIRLAIILLYIVLVAQLRDIHRVFAYHGAEHKAVNALESGAALEVEQVRGYSTAHTRCGTAFLLLVVVICVLVFAPFGVLPFGWRIVSRVLLVPVVAAISYELMRLGANHAGRPWVRTLLSPALFLQRLTARPPDDAMLEVALAALRRARELDTT